MNTGIFVRHSAHVAWNAFDELNSINALWLNGHRQFIIIVLFFHLSFEEKLESAVHSIQFDYRSDNKKFFKF